MSKANEQSQRNRVYLVGAGPGNPELVTVRALKVLRQADVILYDRLVTKGILKLIDPKIMKVYVGKGHESTDERQNRIYQLILKYHSKGLKVVRLQNGDPLLLGRGGEEIQFLRDNGIDCEIVPGITSAVGVASSLGLPLTDRRVSSEVMIMSGHPMKGKEIDLKLAAKFPGTVVVLMGAHDIGRICNKLIEKGKYEGTPACMIMKGTLSGEKVVAGRLDELGKLARKEGIRHPAVTIIGDVVRFAKFYNE